MTVESLVAKAIKTCHAKGVRFTPTRERVFRLLGQSQEALGAYDLLDQLKIEEPSAKPATIYRSLDFLIDQGFVHKIESINTYKLCHHFGCDHPVQFLICDKCGNVEELQSERVESSLQQQASERNFVIHHQTIEAHGICDNCR